MKELSLNILDITENSVKAGASDISITIDETEEILTLTISDNGCGMTKDFLEQVTDPFCTTRTTRKVGMGIPLLKLAAEQTGGSFDITSKAAAEYPDSHGTQTKALLYKNHMDFTPMGDIILTLITLIQGSPDINFYFRHNMPGHIVSLTTVEMRDILGDVPLNSPDVLVWIKEYLHEQYQSS